LNAVLFRPPAPTPAKSRRNLFSLLRVLRDNPLEAWTEAHFEQPIVRDGLPFMPALIVSEPAAIKHVLLDNAANYRKDDLLQRILSPGLSNGLLTVEAEQWKRQRRTVAPMFARRTIHDFAPMMQAAIDALVGRWRKLPEGSAVDVAPEMTGLTLDVLQRTIFSSGIEGGTEDFAEAMRVYFDTIGRIDPFDALGLPQFLPRPTRWPERAALAYFDEAVDAIIRERRRLLAQDGAAAPRDLLTLLLAAADADEPLNESEIRANVLTFIAAGHETTANTLIWALFLLSHAPMWSDAIAQESAHLVSLDGSDPCAHLPITRAVIEEALRLYPPIAAISRVAIGGDDVAGENVAPGTMVIVAPYVVHRHRCLWEAPDVFDPERFLGAAREQIHRYAYLPFGAGGRVCIGQAFALQEATLALAAIVRDFRLEADPDAEVEPLLRITLRPRGGLRMLLKHRSNVRSP
jgi:cytochrome P450